jgi:hypothetical protein
MWQFTPRYKHCEPEACDTKEETWVIACPRGANTPPVQYWGQYQSTKTWKCISESRGMPMLRLLSQECKYQTLNSLHIRGSTVVIHPYLSSPYQRLSGWATLYTIKHPDLWFWSNRGKFKRGKNTTQGNVSFTFTWKLNANNLPSLANLFTNEWCTQICQWPQKETSEWLNRCSSFPLENSFNVTGFLFHPDHEHRTASGWP